MAIDISVTGWRRTHGEPQGPAGDVRAKVIARLRARAAAIPPRRAVDMRSKSSAIFKRGRRGR
jgi:hypothetical protein